MLPKPGAIARAAGAAILATCCCAARLRPLWRAVPVPIFLCLAAPTILPPKPVIHVSNYVGAFQSLNELFTK